MNVRKSENGVKRTREHKEFPAGNDSGLSDLDGMERLCCCRKETFCFRQLPQQQVYGKASARTFSKGALRTPRSAQEDMCLRIFILGTCLAPTDVL